MKSTDILFVLFLYKNLIKMYEEGLIDFVKNYESWGIKTVAFPKLGCGLGGLNWSNDVQPLMHKYLNQVKIPVFMFV